MPQIKWHEYIKQKLLEIWELKNYKRYFNITQFDSKNKHRFAGSEYNAINKLDLLNIGNESCIFHQGYDFFISMNN